MLYIVSFLIFWFFRINLRKEEQYLEWLKEHLQARKRLFPSGQTKYNPAVEQPDKLPTATKVADKKEGQAKQ